MGASTPPTRPPCCTSQKAFGYVLGALVGERRTGVRAGVVLGAVGAAGGWVLSGRADVSIRGRRFPVVGSICMDLMMVNLGPPESAPPAEVGDEVVLFGPDGGPSVQDVADWSETIAYEVVTRVRGRVPRFYAGEEAPSEGVIGHVPRRTADALDGNEAAADENETRKETTEHDSEAVAQTPSRPTATNGEATARRSLEAASTAH
ncbi:MAG: hypothetical protein BRD30_01810 [Bacteroidetes bacterium QH_2_63_10]|nr:MAG: hypothetical protein BRD30_01810 [Bacteroidetes bacterium QH_2_63_10]